MPRRLVVPSLVALAAASTAAPAGAQQRRIFISPMGEPFRGSESAPDPERAWFDGADADHDGTVTRAEFQKDASRFFATLDQGRDGEIDPGDIDRYESVVAPEVRSGEGPGIVAPASGDGGSGGKAPAYDTGRLGAARFSYFSLPEPVTAADRNFNRGIDAAEFAYAAEQRFKALDKNGDGRLAWSELPHVSARAQAPDRRGGRGRGPGGGHRRGGRGGGDFGGGGFGGGMPGGGSD